MKKSEDCLDQNNERVNSKKSIVNVLLSLTAVYAVVRIGFGISDMTKDNKGADADKGVTDVTASETADMTTRLNDSEPPSNTETALTTAATTARTTTEAKTTTTTTTKTTADEASSSKKSIVPITTAEPAPAEKAADIVVANEDMWLDLANVHFPKERVEEIRNSEYATGYGITTYCGCWFEDLDFDGTPEFIMGGFNPGWQGGSGYALYKIHDGKMERIFNKHSSHKIDEERPFVYDSVYVDHNYNYKVWMLPGFISAGGAEVIKDKHGDFKYVFPSSGAESPNGGYYLTELTVNSNEFDQPHGGFVRFAYVPDTETKTLYQQCRISDETAESGYRECSQNELLAAVDDFFEDSESYISTIGVIPCSNLMDDKDEKWLADGADTYADKTQRSCYISSCYDNMTRDEKRQALIDSYERYSLKKDIYTDVPYIYKRFVYDIEHEEKNWFHDYDF